MTYPHNVIDLAGAARVALLVLTFLAGAAPLRAGPAATQPAAPPPPPRWYDPKDPPPAPPMQGAPWTPPGGAVPKALVEATADIFSAGWPDPRGCEFGYLFVRMHGGTELISGWLLPGADREGRRYGIGWDGLVVPVIPHKPADLAAEAAARARIIRRRVDARRNQDNRAPPEVEHPGDLQDACTLLRLGQGELAARMYEAWKAHLDLKADPATQALRGRLLTGWNDRLQTDAIEGFHKGDDWRTLSRAAQVDRLVAAGAGGQKFEDRPNYRQIVAQVRESTKGGPVVRVLEAGLDKYPGRDQRIAALIRDLETHGMSDRRAWWGPDSVRDELVQEGQAAIEPLLRCAEKDFRLTRSRDDGTIIPVCVVAGDALGRMLFGEARAYSWADPPARKEFLARVRRHVKENAGRLPPVRTSLPARAPETPAEPDPPAKSAPEVLADEKAGPALWAQAALAMTGVEERFDVFTLEPEFWEPAWPHAPPTDAPADPAARRRLADLMRKRIAFLIAAPDPAPLPQTRAASTLFASAPADAYSPLQAACAIAHCLPIWQPGEPARGTLAAVNRLCMDRQLRRSGAELTPAISAGIAHRVALGDSGALAEYVAWLGRVPETLLLSDPMGFLQPLVTHPRAAPVVEIGNWLFGEVGSPLLDKRPDGRLTLKEQVGFQAPLLALDGYRRYVLRALTDERPALETLSRRAMTAHITGGFLPDLSDMRACDWWAWRLTTDLPGMRPFVHAAKPADKRKAIAACIDQVSRYGRYYVEWPDPAPVILIQGGPTMVLALPSPSRPATEEDVRGGHAVFSLPGPGPRRLVDIGQLPCSFAWAPPAGRPDDEGWSFRTLREDERSPGRSGLQIDSGEGSSTLCQAEEIFREGKWHRYYGVVLSDRMDCVPAERVCFPGAEGRPLSNGLDAILSLPRRPWDDAGLTRRIFRYYREDDNCLVRPGQPAPVSLRLYNRSPLDKSLPGPLFRAGPGGRFALAPGIQFRAWYLPLPAADLLQHCSSWTWNEEDHWFPLPVHPPAPLPPDPAAATLLRPRQTVEGFSLDLRNVIDMGKPGVYRVRVLFDDKAGGFARGYTHAITVRVAEK